MTANIRPQGRPHRECWRLDRKDPPGTVGDVRACPHGRIQVRTATSPRSRMQGPGMDWWRTLSPFWNPVLYRRAEEALFSEARRQSKEETIRIRSGNGGW